MGKTRRCTYCGGKTSGSLICANCIKKRQLIKKIRAIVFKIKRQAQQEAMNDQG